MQARGVFVKSKLCFGRRFLAGELEDRGYPGGARIRRLGGLPQDETMARVASLLSSTLANALDDSVCPRGVTSAIPGRERVL